MAIIRITITHTIDVQIKETEHTEVKSRMMEMLSSVDQDMQCWIDKDNCLTEVSGKILEEL